LSFVVVVTQVVSILLLRSLALVNNTFEVIAYLLEHHIDIRMCGKAWEPQGEQLRSIPSEASKPQARLA
jgi:hypothetical protein